MKHTSHQENNIEALQKELQRVKVLSDFAFEGIFIHNQWRLIDMNDEFGKIFGYQRDELLGQNTLTLLFPKEYHPVLKKRIKLNYSEPFELTAKNKAGEFFDIEIEGREIILQNKVLRATSIRNISKRKEAEKAFIKEKYLSDRLINSLPGIFYLYKLIEDEYKLIRWNKNHEVFTGYSFDELTNKLISDFFTEEEFPKIQEAVEKVFLTGSEKVEGNLKMKDDSTVPYLLEGYSFTDDGDKYFMGVGLDISLQKELEKKILQSIVETEENERTRFSVDLHDGLSPLLSACKIYTEAIGLAKTSDRKEKALTALNSTLEEAIAHMHEISNNISPSILQNYGLETAIKSYYTNLEDVTKTKFMFNSNLAKGLKKNVETSLYRIIIELINNSVKYSQANVIAIDLRQSNKYLNLKYTDNGIGFNLENELSIPSGMGINNIINRIKALNGTYTLKSKPNEGMLLTVRLSS